MQAKLKENASGNSRRLKAQHPSLLTGLLFDSEQRPMTPAHATKGKTTRYRYYITRAHKADTTPVWRVNAHDIEQLTTDRLAAYLNSPAEIAKLAGSDVEATTLQNALAQADLTAAMLRSGAANSKYELIQRLAERIILYADHIVVRLRPDRLASLLGLPASDEQTPVTLTVPAKRARKGHQIRLVIPGEEAAELPKPPKRDEKAIFLLAEAFEARKLVTENPTLSLAAIAKAHGRCHKHLAKLIERSFVAPEDLVAIFAVK